MWFIEAVFFYGNFPGNFKTNIYMNGEEVKSVLDEAVNSVVDRLILSGMTEFEGLALVAKLLNYVFSADEVINRTTNNPDVLS